MFQTEKKKKSYLHTSGRIQGYPQQFCRAAGSQDMGYDLVLKVLYVVWHAALLEEEDVD